MTIREQSLAAFRKTALNPDDPMLWHVWKRAFDQGYFLSDKRIKELERRNIELEELLDKFRNPLKHE